jgi:uncharacterized membrane protein YczE
MIMLLNFLKAKITHLPDSFASAVSFLSIGLILMGLALGCAIAVIWVLAMSLYRLPMTMVRRGTRWVNAKHQQSHKK